MPKAMMMVYTEPTDPSRDDEFRQWYDHHIAEALRVVDGMPRAVRYKLSAEQGHEATVPAPYLTIYEIDADDVDAVHERLSAAYQNGDIPNEDVGRGVQVVYWDFDAEILKPES